MWRGSASGSVEKELPSVIRRTVVQKAQFAVDLAALALLEKTGSQDPLIWAHCLVPTGPKWTEHMPLDLQPLHVDLGRCCVETDESETFQSGLDGQWHDEESGQQLGQQFLMQATKQRQKLLLSGQGAREKLSFHFENLPNEKREVVEF